MRWKPSCSKKSLLNLILIVFQEKYIISIKMRSYQQNIVSRPSTSIPTLLQQFNAIDYQNKELIKLAEQIQRSSFMSNDTYPPLAILRIEEDLRRNLAALISNIHQAIYDIDKRLQALTQFFEQTSSQQKTMSTQHSQHYTRQNLPRPRSSNAYTANHTLPIDPYQSLVQRISALEMSLRNSQKNEAKLISILQKIQKRNQQQPNLTLGSSSEVQSKVYRDYTRNSMQKSKEGQGNFRLFVLQRLNNKNKSENQSAKAGQQKGTLRNPFTCGDQPQKDNIQHPRMQLKLPPINYQKSEASTHSRRISFMMNTLNS